MPQGAPRRRIGTIPPHTINVRFLGVFPHREGCYLSPPWLESNMRNEPRRARPMNAINMEEYEILQQILGLADTSDNKGE